MDAPLVNDKFQCTPSYFNKENLWEKQPICQSPIIGSVSSTPIPLHLNLSRPFMTIPRHAIGGQMGIPRHLIKQVPVRNGPVIITSCLWFPTGHRMLWGLANGEIATVGCDIYGCEDVKRILTANGDISALAYSKDHDTVILGDSGGSLHFCAPILAPRSNSLQLYPASSSITQIESSPNGEKICVQGQAAYPMLVDLDKTQPISKFTSFGYDCTCISYHPKRDLVLAGARSQKCEVWDARSSLNAAVSIFGHQASLTDVAWHPCNDYIFASAGRDGLILVWDMRNCKIPTKLLRSSTPTQEPIDLEATSTHEYEDYSFRSFLPQKTAPTRGTSAMTSESIKRGLLSGTRRCPNCFQWVEESQMISKNAEADMHPFATILRWHPLDSNLLATGSASGVISFWNVVSPTQAPACRVMAGNAGWAQQRQLVTRGQIYTKEQIPATAVTHMEWHPLGTTLVSATSRLSGWTGTMTVWGYEQDANSSRTTLSKPHQICPDHIVRSTRPEEPPAQTILETNKQLFSINHGCFSINRSSFSNYHIT